MSVRLVLIGAVLVLTGCVSGKQILGKDCRLGACLHEEKHWAECYKACTCGCWKDQYPSTYNDSELVPNELFIPPYTATPEFSDHDSY